MSVRTRLDRAAKSLRCRDGARASRSTEALKPSELGTVGLELERHVVDVAAPGSVVSWRRLQAAIARAGAAACAAADPGARRPARSFRPCRAPASATRSRRCRPTTRCVQQALAAAGLRLLSIGVGPRA